MRIEAEHFDIAARAAYKTKNDAGIVFDTEAMAVFRTTLNELARNRKSTDAPVLTDEEFKAIKPAFNALLMGAVANFASKSSEVKDGTNIQEWR